MSKDDEDKPEKLLAPVPMTPHRPVMKMANPKGSIGLDRLPVWDPPDPPLVEVPQPEPPTTEPPGPIGNPMPFPLVGPPGNPKGNPLGRFPLPDALPEARVRDRATERRRFAAVLLASIAIAIIAAIVWLVQR